LIDLFSKRSRGLGAEPQVAPAGAKPFSAFLLILFFAPAVSKKRMEWIRTCNIEKTLSVLFEQGAAKRTKNSMVRFRLCGGDEGSALDLRPFWKKVDQKLSSRYYLNSIP
jgi:hypothetical protein